MDYTVFIPVAGLGTRLKDLTKNLNKCLIDINNTPNISHIINNFQKSVKFVIAIGHKGDLVKEYLKLTYPERNFKFVKIKTFKGKNSGLGLTIFKCKKYLQTPFIFIPGDTLFKKKIKKIDFNWIGYKSGNSSHYRKIKNQKLDLTDLLDKKNKSSKKIYSGIFAVKDYKDFWENCQLKNKDFLKNGESYVVKKFLKKGIKIKTLKIDWHDVGNVKSLDATRKIYNKKFLNILEKENEKIWFVKDKVIKFNINKNFIKKRYHRSIILKNFVPKIISKSDHFYIYKKVEGKIISKVLTKKIFLSLLKRCKILWNKKIKKPNINNKNFQKNCELFYKDKTIERVSMFLKSYKLSDKYSYINNYKIPNIKTLLKNIDWNYLSMGKKSLVHGDLHFENILYSKGKFIFLDWRQDFSNNLYHGDLYYDLAKLMHGFIVSHNSIVKNKYKISEYNKKVKFKINNPDILSKLIKIFDKWIIDQGYDLKKIKILTSLIFLNIACLHHYPYNKFLFYLGKYELFKSLNYEN